MGARQKDWARRKRVWLIEQLGGKCVYAHDGLCSGGLELDCKEPQGHKHHTLEQSHRMSFYLRQFRAGNLQLACQHHNAVKGLKEKAANSRQLYFIATWKQHRELGHLICKRKAA